MCPADVPQVVRWSPAAAEGRSGPGMWRLTCEGTLRSGSETIRGKWLRWGVESG